VTEKCIKKLQSENIDGKQNARSLGVVARIILKSIWKK
jgi:hypothetical protein